MEESWKSELFLEKRSSNIFQLISPWGEKILDGNWPQGDNGELSIPINDC